MEYSNFGFDLQCVNSFADVFDNDSVTVSLHSPVESDAAKLDPLTTFTQGLESLEPDLAAAYPSPPYDSQSNMSSPTYNSTLEDEILDLQKLLDDDRDPLLGDVLGNININLGEEENVENDKVSVSPTVSSPNVLSPNIVSPVQSPIFVEPHQTDSLPATVTLIDFKPKEYTPTTVVNAPTTKYTLRTRPQPTRTFSGKKAPEAIDPERQTVATSRKRVAERTPERASSMSPEYEPEETIDKSNKAAIQARINRQKKKAYIEGLENQVADLTGENTELKKENQKLDKERNSLLQEVAYLKNVLANDSMLSGLLGNINNVPGVRLTSSFRADRDSTARDHDYGRPAPAKRAKKQQLPMSSGVCLHVDNNNVSLEFCSKCAKMSAGAGRENQS